LQATTSNIDKFASHAKRRLAYACGKFTSFFEEKNPADAAENSY